MWSDWNNQILISYLNLTMPLSFWSSQHVCCSNVHSDGTSGNDCSIVWLQPQRTNGEATSRRIPLERGSGIRGGGVRGSGNLELTSRHRSHHRLILIFPSRKEQERRDDCPVCQIWFSESDLVSTLGVRRSPTPAHVLSANCNLCDE